MRANFSTVEFLPFKGHVYEPADDSYLLVDGIMDEIQFIKEELQPDKGTTLK